MDRPKWLLTLCWNWFYWLFGTTSARTCLQGSFVRRAPPVAGYVGSVTVGTFGMRKGFSDGALFSQVWTSTLHAPSREVAVEGAVPKTLAVITLRNGVSWCEPFHSNLDFQQRIDFPDGFPVLSFLDLDQECVGGNPFKFLIRFCKRSCVGYRKAHTTQGFSDLRSRSVLSKATNHDFDFFFFGKGEGVIIFLCLGQMGLEETKVLCIVCVNSQKVTREFGGKSGPSTF